MTTPHVSPLTKAVLTVEFLLLAYMLYVLSTSLYKSYQVDRFIEQVSEENKKLEQTNASLAEDYEYYRSDAYKEKIAKQNLNLMRPGEEVIILTPEDKPFLTPAENSQEAAREYHRELSNPRKWFLFFFERER